MKQIGQQESQKHNLFSINLYFFPGKLWKISVWLHVFACVYIIVSSHFHFCSILLLLYLFILRTQNLILLMFLYFFFFFIEPIFFFVFILNINNLSSQPNILFLRFSLKYIVQIRLKFQINGI